MTEDLINEVNTWLVKLEPSAAVAGLKRKKADCDRLAKLSRAAHQ